MKKRIISIICSIAMLVTTLAWTPAVKTQAKVLDDVAGISRQAAAEGCVLLKNDNNTLPYDGGTKVSVFGRMQLHYYKTGTGSGGFVNVPYEVNILDGLRKNGSVKVNEELASIYAEWDDANPFVAGGGWASEPHYQKEMPLKDDVVATAASHSDAALVVIGRTAGEDQDNKSTDSYVLTEAEEDMLSKVSAQFNKVTVVLNVSNIIDMKWVDKYSIDAVLYVWQGGMIGGDVAADIITGDVNPSGHLPDTIAYDYKDYPSADNYGGTTLRYQEDIYVGYRYFETFAKDKVMYPFGYGLSYTTFDIDTISTTNNDKKITVKTKVKNTGHRAGKQVVQVYYGAPQGKLGQPARELAAFAKTKLLEAGESQEITLSFNIDDMASYDDSGVTGHDSAYVLEAGNYKVYVGDNVRSASHEYTYNQQSLKVVEQLSEQMAPSMDFERMKPVENGDEFKLTYEKVPKRTTDVMQKINDSMPKEIKQTEYKGYKLTDVEKGTVTMDQFIAQLTDNELMAIVKGDGMSPGGVTGGVAGAFGGVRAEDGSDLVEKYNIARACCADGPSGIRSSDKASSMPNGTCIASTWNLDLIEKLFKIEGEELVLNEIDALLGPGINIHRNPLNGRNFEYFAEDPLLSGMMAAAETTGMQSAGATVTLKHMACNNQEEARTGYDANVSERALREIYLKTYEIAVKSSEPRAIMTSYNKVNGFYSASNYEMNTEILRKEWGYTGIVMTDWWANKNKNLGNLSAGTSVNYTASMVKAQNDLDMVSVSGTDLKDSLQSGYLKRSELQRCAINVCNYVMKSQAFARLKGVEFVPYKSTITDWFDTSISEMGDPKLSGISVGGRAIKVFKPYTMEYKVYNPLESDNLPEVKATAQDKETVTIKQATLDNPVAKIYVKEDGEQAIYRVIFTNEGNITPVFDNPRYAVLTGIKINDKSLPEFDSSVFSYAIALDDPSVEPTITPVANDDVNVKVTYDKKTKQARITCQTTDQANYYSLNFGGYPKSDEFDGMELSKNWTIENENDKNWLIGGGILSIKTERGSLYEGYNNANNVFAQQAYGNWEAVAKVNVDTTGWSRYQNVGVAVKQDDNNYIALKLEHSGTDLKLQWAQEKKGTAETVNEKDLPKDFKGELYFKICKKGNLYTGSFSIDGKEYTKMDRYLSAAYSNPQYSLIVINTEGVGTSTTQRYDYVHFDTNIEIAPPVKIDGTTKLKVAELEPIDMSSIIRSEDCSDVGEGKNFGYCDGGEFVSYNIDVIKDGAYDLMARVASNESNTAQMQLIIYLDDQVLGSYYISGTGGYQEWVTTDAKEVNLPKGEHKIKIYFATSGMNLNWIKFKSRTENDDPDDTATIFNSRTSDPVTFDEQKEINGVTYDNCVRDEKVKAFASSQENNNSAVEYAIDNYAKSRWASEMDKDPQYVIVELNGVFEIHEIDINWEGASAKSYQVLVSEDGSNWEEAYFVEKASKNNRVDEIQFRAPVRGRYVKILGLSRTTTYGYSIYEIGIYGQETESDVVPHLVIETTTKARATTKPTIKPTTKPTTEATTSKKESEVTKSVANNDVTNKTISASSSAPKAKVKKASKKLRSNTIKISLKKIKKISRYQIQISKKAKFKKKNIIIKKTVKKATSKIKSKKLKGKKKLWVRARAIKNSGNNPSYGKWSNKKKVKIVK